MELKKLTDKELISIANKNGSFNQIYTILYGRHKNNVDNFLYKYIKNNEEREDASQDALIKVFLHLDKYIQIHHLIREIR